MRWQECAVSPTSTQWWPTLLFFAILGLVIMRLLHPHISQLGGVSRHIDSDGSYLASISESNPRLHAAHEQPVTGGFLHIQPEGERLLDNL